MLLELTITNFAIIDHLSLSFARGFNVLTGETGAGKSIVIDAVSALLGGRVGAEYLRAGADKARVEGVFSLGSREANDGLAAERIEVDSVRRASAQLERLQPVLDEYGLDDGEGTIILCREIGASGRTVARVNGRAVPTAVLQQIGRELVDIHGQGEHLSLLNVPQHLELLDEYAGLGPQRIRLAAEVARLRQVKRDLQSLLRDERELARRVDLLRYQVDEIEAAELVTGEEETLAAERRKLGAAETLIAAADLIYKLLYEGIEDQRSSSDLLGEASLKLTEAARHDPELEGVVTTAEGILVQIEDLARSLRTYRDGIDRDPERLEMIEERIELLRNLKRKYGNSIAEILKYGAQAAEELQSLTHSEERIAELQAQEADLLGEIGRQAEQLSVARTSAAAQLAGEMEAELADLNMPKARFCVAIERNEALDGAPFLDGKRYAFDSTGADRVEFTISPNPGEPLKPLAKIASGGETARIMLALKTILCRADPVPTLIFDEIDQGIGGRSGQIVGKKLWRLAAEHQVLCVTHLAQIACFADEHSSVAKKAVRDRTVASVNRLQGKERIEEVVAMLGGSVDSEVGLRNAEEMLAEAEAWKEQADSDAAAIAKH